MTWLWGWMVGGGPGQSITCWVLWANLLRYLTGQHWLRDSVSPPEGVHLVLAEEHLVRMREELGADVVDDLPPLPLTPHQQPRVLGRMRTWEVYLPAPMAAAVAGGLLDLHIHVLPPGTRVKIVGVQEPRPPRRPRGGHRVRLPRMVRPAPAAGWA